METFALSFIFEILRDVMVKLKEIPEEDICSICLFKGNCPYPEEGGPALCTEIPKKLEKEGLV